MKNLLKTRKILIFLFSLPLLIVGLIFDLMKLPVVIFFFAPLFGFFWFIDWLKKDVILNYWKVMAEVALLGTIIYMDTVWDKTLIEN